MNMKKIAFYDNHAYMAALGLPIDSTRFMVQSLSGDNRGIYWEFSIDAYELPGDCVCVKVFHDAFAAFAEIPEFFDDLAALGKKPTIHQIRDLLADDFHDRTEELIANV